MHTHTHTHTQLKPEMVDLVYSCAKFKYECGNYSDASEYLYFYRVLVCESLMIVKCFQLTPLYLYNNIFLSLSPFFHSLLFLFSLPPPPIHPSPSIPPSLTPYLLSSLPLFYLLFYHLAISLPSLPPRLPLTTRM